MITQAPFLLGHLRRSLSFFHLLPLLLLPGHFILDEMVIGPPGQGSNSLWQALLFLTACLSPLLGGARLLPLLASPHTAPLLSLSLRPPLTQTGIRTLALFLNSTTHLLSLWLSGLLLLHLWGAPPPRPWSLLASSLVVALTATLWATLGHAFLSTFPALFASGAGLLLGYILPPLAQVLSPQVHPLSGTLLLLLSLPIPDLNALEGLLLPDSGIDPWIWAEWVAKCVLLFTLASRSHRS